MLKPKRINKTKEQLIKELETQAKVKVYRAFVKDEFYPLLLEATTSIDDAKYLLGSFSNMLMEQFLGLMKEKKFVELELEKKLDSKAENYESYKKILDIFKDKNIFDARELIEGMKEEIDMMITNELKERKLETLKTQWYK